jgi:hypothetical protein
MFLVGFPSSRRPDTQTINQFGIKNDMAFFQYLRELLLHSVGFASFAGSGVLNVLRFIHLRTSVRVIALKSRFVYTLFLSYSRPCITNDNKLSSEGLYFAATPSSGPWCILATGSSLLGYSKTILGNLLVGKVHLCRIHLPLTIHISARHICTPLFHGVYIVSAINGKWYYR